MKTWIAALLLGLVAAASSASEVERHSMKVTSDGFNPSEIKVEANKPVVLNVTRETDKTCAKKFAIPEYNIEQDLPLNKEVAVRFTPQKAGKVTFGCSMKQMVRGVLVVN